MELERIYRLSTYISELKIISTPTKTELDFINILEEESIPESIIQRKMGTLFHDIYFEIGHLSLFPGLLKDMESFLSNITDSYEKINEKQLEIIKKYDIEKKKIIDNELRNLQYNIHQKALIWEERILTMLRKTHIVKLTTKTSLNPEWLINGAKNFFKQNIWDSLTDLQKADLEDGCRCLTIEAWTPAAMIIMRSVESALRSYYKDITGNTPTGKNMGSLIGDLRKHSDSDRHLVNHFDYLRELRNKTQHPEDRYTKDEAVGIFMKAINIMNSIPLKAGEKQDVEGK